MSEPLNVLAVKELLYKMADDLLILGHRNSEWTGLGPLLEEDIAFSSMAQDKIGQSLALYKILQSLGEQDPDTVAFMRNAEQFHCCRLVELPCGEYDFSLVRHFLFDHADYVRFELLQNSSFEPLAQLARKIRGELKYHVLHADVWIKKLGSGTEESVERMQRALDEAMPYALGIFETSEYEDTLIETGVFIGEDRLKELWLSSVKEIIAQTQLSLPDTAILTPSLGGRKGRHTEHLQPLLDEMSEVFRIDPKAEW